MCDLLGNGTRGTEPLAAAIDGTRTGTVMGAEMGVGIEIGVEAGTGTKVKGVDVNVTPRNNCLIPMRTSLHHVKWVPHLRVVATGWVPKMFLPSTPTV